MPIIIRKGVEWKQTEHTLTIKVPFKNAISSKTDVFYAKKYVKSSYEQFFYEAFLSFPIKPKESRCTFTDDYLIFELTKEEPAIWEQLEQDFASKGEKMEIKIKYIAEEHEIIQKECEERRNKTCELKRTAVREQVKLDSQQRKAIGDVKEEEKANALKDMDAWRNREKSQRRIKEKSKNKKVATPAVRSTRSLQVFFTEREFPTPSRESRLEEENEWLRKQAEARRSAGFISDDIRPEERNPQFLKAKGDDFLKNENYLGAISAYSFGIKLNENFADLYIARAQAHLSLGNYNKAAQDCNRALELLKPAVPINLKERALCIGRRGIALVKLGLLKEGIGELKASLKLCENDEFNVHLNEAVELFTTTKETS